jgi:Zn-dependent alcohol dehydrogenase
MGQIHVRRFLPKLLKYIEDGKLHLEFVISHRMRLDEAATGTVCPAKKMMIAARSC